MKIRTDLLDKNSAKGIEVLQLTSDKDVTGSHVYMEAQIFTPDSKRFVLHRSANSHGSNHHDPKHQYLVCDIEDGCRLTPITEEIGATAPSVTPDGQFMYYFVNETEINGGRLILKRVRLDGSDRGTIMVVDTELPGTRFRPSRIYSLSTISSDGKRLALPAFMGDGQTAEMPPFGMMVFDLDNANVQLVISGPTWCNMHPQYSRSLNPEESHDILIQEAHSYAANASGEITSKPDGKGTDIHVIRDDGTNFRTMPWGRDGNERCQGHQCWRGRSHWAITSTHTHQPPEAQLIEGLAVPDAGHLGLKTPEAVRNELSREFPSKYFYQITPGASGSSNHISQAPLTVKSYFYHFATDIEGRRIITDAAPLDNGGRIFVAELGEAGKDPLKNFRLLLNPHNGPYSKTPESCHIHPFLSPDGTMAFFNSDESGISQAYMIRGL
ncbi:MAG TPA: hypothetical protein DET40_05325 [Lentisphaeria bacterium]|nr:MAG: hypothetical protein A2X45_21920 [Lentisphaerae bacterium GWF2_50_93]HCE42948.1 hypothetical protein [Lentisphaeria bacterium]